MLIDPPAGAHVLANPSHSARIASRLVKMKSASRITLCPLVRVEASEKGRILATGSGVAGRGAGGCASSGESSMMTPFVVERRRQKRQDWGLQSSKRTGLVRSSQCPTLRHNSGPAQGLTGDAFGRETRRCPIGASPPSGTFLKLLA